MNKTIKLTLRNNSKPNEVVIRSSHDGEIGLALKDKGNLFHWFGDLPRDKLLFVEASVITSYGETRFFVQSYKAA